MVLNNGSEITIGRKPDERTEEIMASMVTGSSMDEIDDSDIFADLGMFTENSIAPDMILEVVPAPRWCQQCGHDAPTTDWRLCEKCLAKSKVSPPVQTVFVVMKDDGCSSFVPEVSVGDVFSSLGAAQDWVAKQPREFCRYWIKSYEVKSDAS